MDAIDKSQVPPLHQKRILAFVNHFLISSCGFLNEFALKCETKFVDLERKMQKVEAALAIIEAKLASIPDVESTVTTTTTAPTAPPPVPPTTTAPAPTPAPPTAAPSPAPPTTTAPPPVAVEPMTVPEPAPSGIRACDDVRYKKFFKMVQVGVPAGAVKIKMQAEGVDANILDTPHLMLPDGNGS